MAAEIEHNIVHAVAEPQVIVYGHSWLFYWWPVWLVGYLMALITWLRPVDVQLGASQVLFSSGTNLGIIYCLVVLLTILITNTSMHGLMSLMVVIVVGFFALLFAYLDWWPAILRWFGHQAVYMNMGFYLFFSSALLLIWLLVVVGFDHLGFW